MATGDSTDLLRRLNSLIPNGWFADVAPVRDVVHGGLADGLAWSYALLQVVRGGTRRLGTTGWLLDVDAWGFFGPRFLRRANEDDDTWRARYTGEIFRPRVTRAAIIRALVDLTGIAPIVINPANPNDTSAWDVSFWDVGVAGSTDLNNQYFITAFRPSGGGIADIAGFDAGFWDSGDMAYVDQSMVASPVPDAAIYDCIARTTAAGVIAWTMIENHV